MTTDQIAAEAWEQACPFCGGLGVLLSTNDFPRRQQLWVQCNDCGAQGPRFKCYSGDAKGSDEAWLAWNSRAAQASEQVPPDDWPRQNQP